MQKSSERWQSNYEVSTDTHFINLIYYLLLLLKNPIYYLFINSIKNSIFYLNNLNNFSKSSKY